MASALRFHPEAVAEAQQAYDYYTDRSLAAAEELANEIDAAYDAIEDHPERYAFYEHGPEPCRYRRVFGYPYIVVYELRGNDVMIYAVAHTSRRPGYWRHRVK